MRKENITHNGAVQAIIIYAGEMGHGVQFYVENERTLQVGKQRRLRGERITPHRHLPVQIDREETLQEVLYIESGKVKITFYDDRWGEIDSRVLNKGDMILLIRGGHGFEILEETKMIEVKQGPYNPAATQRRENDR